jgi:hypothetical protein
MNYWARAAYGLSLCLLAAIISVPARAQPQASCTFKLFRLPESTTSAPLGVNDRGTVVGRAVSNDGIERGFALAASGRVTYYRAPNTIPNYASYTYFTGRNNVGVTVGVYKLPPTQGLSTDRGFILNGANFTKIVEPKSVWGTEANGINKWDTVVGYYYDAVSRVHGFKRLSDGSFMTLNYPGAQNTYAMGINDSGAIVGSYSFKHNHGFIYYKGQWATIDYPKAAYTILNGISDSGVIIGRSNTSKQGTAFLYSKGVFKVIAVPNSFSTNAASISADGKITGTTNLDGTASGLRGFTATCH